MTILIYLWTFIGFCKFNYVSAYFSLNCTINTIGTNQNTVYYIESTSWKVQAHGIHARVVDALEIERVSPVNELDFWHKNKECVNTVQSTSNVVLCLLYLLRLDLKAHNALRLYVSQNDWSPQGACLILRALCFAPLARHSFRFSISHLVRFLFRVLVFETFHVILDRSIVINKPFLAHVFKLQHLRKLNISSKK